jgi:hypothetical protein
MSATINATTSATKSATTTLRRFAKRDIVWVGQGHIDEHVRGLEGAVIDDTLMDAHEQHSYAVWLYEKGELWYFREGELEGTGRVERRHDVHVVPHLQHDLESGEGTPS